MGEGKREVKKERAVSGGLEGVGEEGEGKDMGEGAGNSVTTLFLPHTRYIDLTPDHLQPQRGFTLLNKVCCSVIMGQNVCSTDLLLNLVVNCIQ